MRSREISGLLIRYLLLIALGIPNLWLFYAVITPLTVYPVFWMLQLFFEVTLLPQNVLFIEGVFARIVPACVAGAAYYLLVILNLTTPMSISKRIKSLAFLIGVFLLINVVRIIAFAVLFVNGFSYFDLTHTVTWYLGSTVIVALVWFANVRVLRIKDVPISTDVKYVLKDVLKRR